MKDFGIQIKEARKVILHTNCLQYLWKFLSVFMERRTVNMSFFTMIFMDACEIIVASNVTAFCFSTNDEMRQCSSMILI